MAASIHPRSVESLQETSSARTFYFGLAEPFDYHAGQCITVKLADVEDPRGPQRPFTLSSSPTEPGRISITIKMTGSPFKETLKKLADDDARLAEQLTLRGPMGDFTLDTERPALMIAGGIGITPFRSMIRHACDHAEGPAITLLYSNDTPDEIAFREELDSLAENNDWLTVVHTITGDTGDWSGRTGRIDADLIAEHAGRLDNPVYYVCGPPDMVGAMEKILEDELTIPEADRRSEKFSGY